MHSKKENTKILLKKIKDIIKKSIEKGNLKKAMAAISFMGGYLYEYNQFYTEDELEEYLCVISSKLKEKYQMQNNFQTSGKIVFYDGFGLDVRGTALIYLNALGLNGYQVIYITNKNQKNNIPNITNLCKKYNFEMEFIDMTNYLNWSKQLSDLLFEIKPKAAFFYTTPNDVSGIVAFHMFEGIVDRYLIDLTDHAFWLGKSAVDYFIGSRDMSASLQYFQRGIEKNKMLKLDVSLIVNSYDEHKGLPFDPTSTNYIFSGGSLYKTLGDLENTYYKIVDYILSKHKEIYFLYAGFGDDSELKKIISKYPESAYYIKERKDFYYLIQNCKLYLNTYPMFGGMMMRYCALAHKIPLTLKHGNDSDDLLLNQRECKIEYSSYEDLIRDIDRLLEDDQYRKEREKLLEGAVLTEEIFKNNIRSIIENHKTDYEYQYVELDTKLFKQEYYERFDYDKEIIKITGKMNRSLFSDFPMLFIKRRIEKLCRKFIKK